MTHLRHSIGPWLIRPTYWLDYWRHARPAKRDARRAEIADDLDRRILRGAIARTVGTHPTTAHLRAGDQHDLTDEITDTIRTWHETTFNPEAGR